MGMRRGASEVTDEIREQVGREAKEALAAAERAKLEKLRYETEKHWNLTPPDLRKLLPGRGEIHGLFYATYHPINEHFRVTYPLGATLAGACCQRKWGTSLHPTKFDALRTVLSFLYNRWNEHNPRQRFAM